MGERASPRRAGVPEQTAVRRWRRSQLLALGFSPGDAAALSKAPVDLADARRLLAAGCPPELARRILL